MKVFRIEHSISKFGYFTAYNRMCYSNEFSYISSAYSHEFSKLDNMIYGYKNSPYEEANEMNVLEKFSEFMFNENKVRFGCTSIEQISIHWIISNDMIELLHTLGFIIVEYTVEDYLILMIQVVFNLDSAQVSNTYSLDCLSYN